MTWIVRYTRTDGEVSTNVHLSRESARDALVDLLLESALQLWQIGMTYPKVGPNVKHRESFCARGDRFVSHAARLMETTEDSYVIAGAGGRKWLLVEVTTSPQPSPADTYEGLTDEEWHDMPLTGTDH